MKKPTIVKLGEKEYKEFQPCPCDCCPQHRPADICIYIEGDGVVCDDCQRARGIAHLNPNL